ncbi:hypothetical protein FA09DRAFT_225963 [Tilletiopsis washingtonensis]|jgi:hypothetical protein|uniref:Secreted protein n=1 Tax=Tilletiopsis washingtonensis TaxID=58919 RepID=A0A316ZE45_9BASI|nr:hypothetical protein FA09DRAFT_225963 [Tilletiopsis washingtonensis]PWN99304.1 hypothetical protein FA09DRAFT_225963 [Tilletiopsis washingtonensis]
MLYLLIQAFLSVWRAAASPRRLLLLASPHVPPLPDALLCARPLFPSRVTSRVGRLSKCHSLPCPAARQCLRLESVRSLDGQNAEAETRERREGVKWCFDCRSSLRHVVDVAS